MQFARTLRVAAIVVLVGVLIVRLSLRSSGSIPTTWDRALPGQFVGWATDSASFYCIEPCVGESIGTQPELVRRATRTGDAEQRVALPSQFTGVNVVDVVG